MDYTTTVADGVALLDKYSRPDWRDRIDLDVLDLGDPYNCVAGQVWGHWWGTPDMFRCHPAFAGNLDSDQDAETLAGLQAAWVAALTPAPESQESVTP